MRPHLRLLPLCFLTISLFTGCASRSPEWDALYRDLSEDPGAFDAMVLEGRRIVIDPGHGGLFRGAMGADSLAEADANLGVGLYLWGLLKEAGADVQMTRSTDRDFLPPGTGPDDQGALRGDLGARMKLANDLAPEVFVSIHHNSNIARDRKRNRVEIYYRAEDPYASLELAEEIHIHLARNLGIEETTIRPGNYYVLRNSGAGASVLGEASYISNPAVEEKLKISTRQRLEAEAYFLGILSYFSRGVPSIEFLEAETDTLELPGSIGFRVSRGAGVPIDPSSLRVTVDGRTVPSVWDAESGILWYPVPADIPNGIYSARAHARSRRGATAASSVSRFTVDRPASFILPLRPEPSGEGRVALRVRILDALGGQVLDGKKVRAVPVEGGRSWRGRTAAGDFVFEVPRAMAASDFIVSVEGFTDTLSFASPALEGLRVRVVDSSSGRPVSGAAVLVAPGLTGKGADDGTLVLPAVLSGSGALVQATGYRPLLIEPSGLAGLARSPLIRLDPVLGGILHGMTIVVDPAGGGQDDYGRGPDLLRGSEVNLEIARRTGSVLAAAGARVYYTRSGEETLSELERIDRVNRHSPDLAIGLRFGSSTAGDKGAFLVHHYPGSERGSEIAGLLAGLLPSLPPCTGAGVSESAGLFLQQTSCPACEIHAPLDGFTEEVMRNPAWLDMQAGLIVEAVARWADEGRTLFAPHTFTVVHEGIPVAGAVVSLDGTFSAVTGAGGRAAFRCVDSGTHSIVVGMPGGGSRMLSVTIGDDAGPESTLEVD